jgi:hypothetical protein
MHEVPGPETCALDLADRPRERALMGDREIGRHLGLPPSTVWEIVRRGLRRFRDALGDDVAELLQQIGEDG